MCETMLNVYCDAAFCPDLKVGVSAWVYIHPITREHVKDYFILLHPKDSTLDANVCEFLAIQKANTHICENALESKGVIYYTDSQYAIDQLLNIFETSTHLVDIRKASRDKVDQAHRYANEVLAYFRSSNYVVCSCGKAKVNVKVGCTKCDSKDYTILPIDQVRPDVRYINKYTLDLSFDTYLTIPSKTLLQVKMQDTETSTDSTHRLTAPLNGAGSRDDVGLAAASLLYSAITGRPGSDLAKHVLELECDEPEIGSDELYLDFRG